MISMTKIISIGLFKSGTRSLMECFRTLGYSTSNYSFNQERLAKWCAGEPFLDEEDVQDEPCFAFWRQLAEAHPEARFVMTIRPFSSWFKSCKANFSDPRDVRIHEGKAISVPRRGKMIRRMKLEKLLGARKATITPALEWLLGIHGGGLDESREFYESVYDSHYMSVARYFRDQPGRLLVWDLTSRPQWEPLCDWLGVPIPPVDFPWVNKTKDRRQWIEDAKKEEAVARQEGRDTVYGAKLHMNPNLFRQVRAMDITVGDVTALGNQIITAVSVDFNKDEENTPKAVTLRSADKKITLDPYYLVWVHREKYSGRANEGENK